MNADDELLKNLDKLHTTELGVERIKRNLFLDTDDVVGWCKAKIDSVKAVITRSGKNWYVNIDNCIITVNAYSYTIITAHRKEMKYTIRELEAFSVIGQEVELTNYHKRNIQISTQFWRKFNADLKKSYLSQFENWIKYAFMIKRNGKLFYFCSIPKRNVIPDGFIYKDIQSYKYLAVEHIGSMDNLYETYRKIYQEILPNTDYTPLQEEFLHFERYDYRFHWNRENSIIEI